LFGQKLKFLITGKATTHFLMPVFPVPAEDNHNLGKALHATGEEKPLLTY
jgi:hypothetical protein